MNAVSEAQPTAGMAGNTPGELLRHERTQRGLTVQQVSEELHLDTWLIEALEENRFLALGAPVYAKGHLRKYAMLLGLSPELIVARYQVIAEPPPPPLPHADTLVAAPALERGLDWRRIDWRRLDWRMYAVVGGLALIASGVVGWWLASSSAGPPVPAPQVALQTEPAPVSPPAEPVVTTPEVTRPAASPKVAPPPAAANRGAPRVQTPVSAPASRAADVRPQPSSAVPKPVTAAVRPAAPRPGVTDTAPRKVAAPVANAAVPPGSQPKVSLPPTGPSSKVATPAASSATVAATEPASDVVPQVSLRLEFAVASWAEVYDGDGRRLLYAVGDPDRPRTVSGKPPLKVVLGMAGSVQARVNGRPIAIPRRIGQDSASFTITAKGSVR